MKVPERRHWRRSVTFVVEFEHISYLFLVFPLLTLNKKMLAGLSRFIFLSLIFLACNPFEKFHFKNNVK